MDKIIETVYFPDSEELVEHLNKIKKLIPQIDKIYNSVQEEILKEGKINTEVSYNKEDKLLIDGKEYALFSHIYPTYKSYDIQRMTGAHSKEDLTISTSSFLNGNKINKENYYVSLFHELSHIFEDVFGFPDNSTHLKLLNNELGQKLNIPIALYQLSREYEVLANLCGLYGSLYALYSKDKKCFLPKCKNYILYNGYKKDIQKLWKYMVSEEYQLLYKHYGYLGDIKDFKREFREYISDGINLFLDVSEEIKEFYTNEDNN